MRKNRLSRSMSTTANLSADRREALIEGPRACLRLHLSPEHLYLILGRGLRNWPQCFILYEYVSLV